MEAVAKHEFNATAEDELSFRKGQILKVDLVVFLFYFWLLLLWHWTFCLLFMVPLATFT